MNRNTINNIKKTAAIVGTAVVSYKIGQKVGVLKACDVIGKDYRENIKTVKIFDGRIMDWNQYAEWRLNRLYKA